MADRHTGTGRPVQARDDITTPEQHPTAYLVLDWNGTVVDDVHRAHAATQAALAATSNAAPIRSIDDFRDRFRLPLPDFFREQGTPSSKLPDATDIWNREMAAHRSPLAPGAKTLLTRAHEVGVAVHIVSGAQAQTVRADAQALRVEPLLDSITGSSHPKRHSVTAARTAPRPLIYIGDTEYDIAEARAAGAIAIGTSYGYRPAHALEDAGAHLVVDDLVNVVPLLVALAESPARSG